MYSGQRGHTLTHKRCDHHAQHLTRRRHHTCPTGNYGQCICIHAMHTHILTILRLVWRDRPLNDGLVTGLAHPGLERGPLKPGKDTRITPARIFPRKSSPRSPTTELSGFSIIGGLASSRWVVVLSLLAQFRCL